MKKTATILMMLMLFLSVSAQQETIFQRGWSAFFDRNDYDEALLCMTRVIDEDPQNGQAWMLLGDIYFKKERYDDALNACHKALALIDDSESGQRAFVYVTCGDIYSAMGDHNRALAEYEQATKANPNYANNFMKLVEEYLKMEKFQKAMEWCEKAREVDGEAAYPIVMQGRIRLEQARKDKKKREELLNKAMLDCKLCIQTHPDYSWGYSTRAEVNYEQGNINAAIDDVTKAYSMTPGNTEAWNFILKMAEEEPEKLLSKLQEQYRQDPNNKDMAYIMGITNEVTHNYDEAIGYYQKAIDDKAEYAIVNRIAYTFAQMGLHEEAIPLMNYQARRNNITEAQRSSACYSLVDYMMGAGQKQKALALADSLVEEFPMTNIIYHSRANARWKNGYFQSAIDDYNVALQLDNDDYNAYALRARMYSMLGMTKEAKADFKRVIQNDSAKTAETVLAYAYLGKKSKAKKALKKYLANKDNRQDYYNLACVYSMLGDNSNALQMLAKALETGIMADFTHIATDPDLEGLRQTQEYTALITLHRNRVAKDKKKYKGTAAAMLKKIQKANIQTSVRDAFYNANQDGEDSDGNANDAYQRMRDAFRNSNRK